MAKKQTAVTKSAKQGNDEPHEPYKMRIERTIVDKLGLKLYDRVSAVVAELVANSYDADAENVTVELPLGETLASKAGGTLTDKGFEIIVEDDGHGMTPQEAIDFYLRVGKDRREDDRQGNLSRHKERKVMGRKGIGKLAPFGVCKTIDVFSAGGEETDKGYRVSHFRLDYEEIVNKTSEDKPHYEPEPLERDDTWAENSGTKIILRNFYKKRVPKPDTFSRQMSYRFATGLSDFRVVIKDNSDDPVDDLPLAEVDIPLQDGTKIDISDDPVIYKDEDMDEDEAEEYDVTGWMALSKKPYKDEFGGVRIYARGKIVAVTADFGLPTGFTGEFTARTYLVGQIFADWLDDEEDLIQTHRQDIVWTSELGQALQEWGKKRFKEVAKKGSKPRRDRVSKSFVEESNIAERAAEKYHNPTIESAAVELGKRFGQFAHEDELSNPDYVQLFSDFILEIAPHKYLVDQLHKIRERSSDGQVAMEDLIELFKGAHIAEITSFGEVVKRKLEAIDVLRDAIHAGDTLERDLQEILEDAPWMIDPRWQPIQSDISLKRFKENFEAWYASNYEDKIEASDDIEHPTKRPDFVLANIQFALRIIEIKKPGHEFDDNDYKRFVRYHEAFKKYFEENPGVMEGTFPKGIKCTIVADGENLSHGNKMALRGIESDGELEQRKTWNTFLRETEQAHEAFLAVREEIQAEVGEDEE